MQWMELGGLKTSISEQQGHLVGDGYLSFSLEVLVSQLNFWLVHSKNTSQINA